MGRRKVTDRQVAEMCELREAGNTFGQISRRFAARGVEISESAISWHCLIQGADAPPPQRQASKIEPGTVMKRGRHVVRTFTEAEDELLLKLEAEGLTRTEIGRRLNRKHNSIIGRLATLARREEREMAQ